MKSRDKDAEKYRQVVDRHLENELRARGGANNRPDEPLQGYAPVH